MALGFSLRKLRDRFTSLLTALCWPACTTHTAQHVTCSWSIPLSHCVHYIVNYIHIWAESVMVHTHFRAPQSQFNGAFKAHFDSLPGDHFILKKRKKPLNIWGFCWELCVAEDKKGLKQQNLLWLPEAWIWSLQTQVCSSHIIGMCLRIGLNPLHVLRQIILILKPATSLDKAP